MARSHKNDNAEFLLYQMGLETMIGIGDSVDGIPYTDRRILAGLGFCMFKKLKKHAKPKTSQNSSIGIGDSVHGIPYTNHGVQAQLV